MVFRKVSATAPDGLFACEAAGLAWLDVQRGPEVVGVLGVSRTELTLARLHPVMPSREAARAFGAALARMHDAGASAFGVGPDGWSGDGFFGPLDEPLPLPSGRFDRWGEFYARCRLVQVRDLLAARGRLTPALGTDLERVVERLLAGDFDDAERPSRVHGDLWSGNVMWTADGVVLIDPAAHGGHRLADLAMLELFGLPHLADVLTAYDAVHRLPTDWVNTVGLHQLYPLGMHAVLFGGGYVHGLAALVARYG